MKVITIGRSKDHNDIVVDDVKVSRNHLQMVMDDQGNYSVLDLNSTNGTFVNGRRITGEVPLQITDELKIGDTVLSWQCYFGSQPKKGVGDSVRSSQTPPSQPPMSPQPPVSDPSPKRWLIYVIIGAAVLLLAAGGGIGWKIHRDKQQKIELEEKQQAEEETKNKQKALDEARDAAHKADIEYEEAMRKAAETQSKEDLAYAEEMKKKKEEAEKNVRDKEQELKKLQQELNKEKENVKAANKRADDEAKAKKEEEEKARKANERASSAEKSKVNAESETKLTKEFYGLLMNTTELQAKQVCKNFNWNVTKGKTAKDVTQEKFDKADNAKKEQIIAALKKAQKTVVEEKDEKDKSNTQTQTKVEETKEATVEPQKDTLKK